jgi:hypothetical protein
MAMIGPGTGSPGVREDVTVTTSQLAATVAALLGEDYRKAYPSAAAPLPGLK